MPSPPTIRRISAFTVRGGGADEGLLTLWEGTRWIDGQIATPMSKYPEYRARRSSFGINVLGALVVEIEASDGTVGFAVTTGGDMAALVVERDLARFVEGRRVTEIEKIWDQMFNATLFCGRKGLVYAGGELANRVADA